MRKDIKFTETFIRTVSSLSSYSTLEWFSFAKFLWFSFSSFMVTLSVFIGGSLLVRDLYLLFQLTI